MGSRHLSRAAASGQSPRATWPPPPSSAATGQGGPDLARGARIRHRPTVRPRASARHSSPAPPITASALRRRHLAPPRAAACIAAPPHALHRRRPSPPAAALPPCLSGSGKTIRFCTKHPVVWIIQPAVRANLGKEKNTTKGGERARLLSLSLKFLAAAATTHAGSFRRAPTPRSTPPNSPQSAPPYPPARFSAPGLYRPLETPPPWLGFRAGLRRRVSGGPDADGARHGNSPSTMVAAIKGFFTEMWRTPWTCSSKVLSCPHPLPSPSRPFLISFPSLPMQVNREEP
ncbi:serine/arginine repetitive matrix protein 1-like [Triticum urartu]|uniref:serine/arginine repetitive matrix protein 1-like n=1 Tax=Triticum urartu TaxID=4572 RepID=UPI002042E69E|nr:serine/arginine repetitive matrix protein 1-like [Triticum urartu]